MTPRQVEVLVFEGCPNLGSTVERARAATVAANVPAEITVVHVETEARAKELRFLGSPSVRVDGVDVDPGARGRDDFGLQCRVYAVGDRLEGTPPAAWIAAALRGEGGAVDEAAREPGGSCCANGGDDA